MTDSTSWRQSLVDIEKNNSPFEGTILQGGVDTGCGRSHFLFENGIVMEKKYGKNITVQWGSN